MIESDYLELAESCDRLLRAPDTNLGRIAIPLLHVIHEHSGWMSQYAPALHPAIELEDWRARVTALDAPRAIVRIGRAMARSLLRAEAAGDVAGPLGNIWGNMPGNMDVLIVSHLSRVAQLLEDDDFYFGALQRQLKERGLHSAVVFVDHLPDGRNEDRRIARMLRQFPSGRFVLPRTVTPGVEAAIWRYCVQVSKSLRAAAHELGDCLDGRLAMLASRQALSVGTAANLRLHASVSEVCRLLQPRIVMTTYEGDACERIIWHAARCANRRPLCVGYQHTRLLKHSYAVGRAINVPGIDCDPDVILTAGDASHARLAASPGLGRTRLILYGSHRCTQPAAATDIESRPDLCLVLPDADDREMAVLFEFALACARRDSQRMFVLRPHPAVQVDTLHRRHVALRSLPDNVTLSVGNTLAQDCDRARYCLYRGSSAVIFAVLAGLKPFYLARPGELSSDPLFALTEWRETVSSPEDFAALVDLAEALPDPAAARAARTLCNRLVAPVRTEALDEMLEWAEAGTSN